MHRLTEGYTIYGIVNRVDNKVLVLAASDPKKHFANTMQALAEGKYANAEIQADYDAYGEAYFTYHFIEGDVKSAEVARKLYHWIAQYESDVVAKGYNALRYNYIRKQEVEQRLIKRLADNTILLGRR